MTKHNEKLYTMMREPVYRLEIEVNLGAIQELSSLFHVPANILNFKTSLCTNA